ncbi:MAG TPA: DUF3352 domain-containing protein [Opitutaceae bacterium]
MKLRLLLGTLLACLPALLSARVPLTQIVGDQTALVWHVGDAPALVANWEHSPWARTWNDEQVAKYFAPLRARLHVEEWDERCKAETGYTVRELLALARGEALITIADFEFARQKPTGDPSVLVALELGDNTAAVEKLLEEAAGKSGNTTASTEDFAGVTVHVRTTAKEEGEEEPETFVWAMVDGTWLLSPQKAVVLAAIDAVKSGGVDNALAKSERFLRAQERTAGSQALFFMNLQSIYPVLQQAVADSAKADSAEPRNPLAPNPAAILAALGLDVLDELYVGFRIDKPATTMSGGLTFRENRGLVKLLAYREGPAPQPAFVPADWPSVSTGRFSFKDAYAALEEILEAFDPRISGLVQGQIKAFNQQLGIDIKRDFIGSLGEEVVSAYHFPKNPSGGAPAFENMEQLVALSLDNADSFTRALEALKQLGGPAVEKMLVKREYLGTTLFEFTPPQVEGRPQGKGFAYAITPRYLFLSIGSAAPVERALQGLGGDQPTIWTQPAVRAALASVPAAAATIQYQDLRALVAPLVETMANAAAMAAAAQKAQAAPDDESGPEEEPGEEGDSGEGDKTDDRMVDPAAKPDAAVFARYWADAIGYGTRESNGFYFKSTLNHPE